MTKLIIQNDRTIGTVTNEIKVGSASDSCSSNLRSLGEITLDPDDSLEFILYDDVQDIYWKNIYELYWTHRGIFGFEDEVEISASHSSSIPEERRDICNVLLNNKCNEDIIKEISSVKKGNTVTGGDSPHAMAFSSSYQGHIILYKTSRPFTVTGTVKAAFCKSGNPSYGSCDYHGIPLHVEIKDNTGSILFSGEITDWMTKRYNKWFQVKITVDKDRVGDDGAAMYVHVF